MTANRIERKAQARALALAAQDRKLLRIGRDAVRMALGMAELASAGPSVRFDPETTIRIGLEAMAKELMTDDDE